MECGLLDVIKNSKRKLMELKMQEIMNPKEEEVNNQGKGHKIQEEEDKFMEERWKLNEALEVMSKEVSKSRIELKLIEDFIHRKI